MLRRICCIALGMLLALVTVRNTSAQPVYPKQARPTIEELQKAQFEQFKKALEALNQPGLPPNFQELQKAQIEQLQEALDEAINQPAFPPGPRGNFSAGMNWGGARLAKVDAAMQENLGLPENEGLLITTVDAESVAAKAGLKANDVLVKINNKAVPNHLDGLTSLVKDQKPDARIELVVVRDGKEETLKSALMPATVQGGFGAGKMGRPGIGGCGGFGGIGGKAGIGGAGGIRRIEINRGIANANGRNINMRLEANGETIVRKEKDDTFSGEYSKDNLKITVAGKFEKNIAKPSEIVVTDGKDTKKYTAVNEVPQQYRPMLQRIMPAANINSMIIPMFPNLRDFPGLPVIPNVDD